MLGLNRSDPNLFAGLSRLFQRTQSFSPVLSVKDWYVPSEEPKVSAEIQELSLQNIRSAQKLLGERLKSNYYKGDVKAKLIDKSKYFDRWISNLQSIRTLPSAIDSKQQ